jgi:NADH-quinone oxidoreductase subunit L
MEILLLLILPLLGSCIQPLFLAKTSAKICGSVATVILFSCFIISLFIFIQPETVSLYLGNWIHIPLSATENFTIPLSFTADKVSKLLLLLITGIGTCIHLYSIGYMSEEKRVYRFFAYLNLFVFAMLCLVLGSNFLVTFLGWEGVGLCSYLLIGYWHTNPANAQAGMKAFIVNRIGDLGLLVAMFTIYYHFHTLDYVELSQKVALLSQSVILDHRDVFQWIGFSLFIAVTGKSAQIPLYVWLPDAMAGPTPVSALIHAATMVTAGIYLMTRCSFLLVLDPTVMNVIATVGCLTAFFAATIGLTQWDIKKVLAYSTVSQLGFMVIACGVGAFDAAIGHLITHAFFKALLFLGAGSVIHGMHHEQDMRHMGGLRKYMPITTITFIIGTLAIIGFPGLAGFFSKDEILYAAWTGPFGHPAFWVIGWISACMTAFYMVRLTVYTFFGTFRGHHAPHESPLWMTVPLIILSFFSVTAGYLMIPHAISELWGGGHSWLQGWLSFPAKEGHGSVSLEWSLMGASVIAMTIFGSIAIGIYIKGTSSLPLLFPRLYRLIDHKWYVDEFYIKVIVNPLKNLSQTLFVLGDRFLIEGIIQTVSLLSQGIGVILSESQYGRINTYLRFFFVSLMLFLVWILV